METHPDKRSAAFENIFGRPGHIPTYDPAYYSQPNNGTQRTSYPPALPPGAALMQSPQQQLYALPPGAAGPTPYRTSYYPVYAPQQQPPRQYYQQHLIPQSSPHQIPHRTPSPYGRQPIPGQEPPDEHPTRQGLTPAQAFQTQVYLNSPMNHAHLQPAGDYAQRTPNLNHYAGGQLVPQYSGSHSYQAPQLPSVEISMSGLGLSDFSSKSSPEDDGDGESSSELPWTHDASPSSASGSRQLHSASSSISRRSKRDTESSATVSLSGHYARSPSPPSVDQHSPSAPRRSSDSARTMPHHTHSQSHSVGRRSGTVTQDRSRSMSASTPKAVSLVDFAGSTATVSPMSQIVATPKLHHHHGARRTPIVYPALLSRVAEAFRARITLSERAKDGLAYQDAFDGREAVDKIAYIIKTTDRNLALLLGRALDAQKFFHDVTYDHRLRDSPHEIYQFRSRLPSPFVSDELVSPSVGTRANGKPLPDPFPNSLALSTNPSLVSSRSENSTPVSATGSSVSTLKSPVRQRAPSVSSADDIPLPSGVFTLLTDCYSPTCTRDALCYSIACPRRLEQQARLNMKPQPGLRRSISHESLGEYPREAGTLWIHSVPQEVVESVTDQEKKRQEAINEAIYTERDFVRDMEYLRDVWVKPLRTRDIIPEPRRLQFVQQVFWNLDEIIAVNTRLRDALTKRQKSYAIVETIGDIYLDVVKDFEPFVRYGSHQLYGKFEFEKEKSSNPVFSQFVDETERLPESRKLELNGYLTKPTTRLARYPLLLEVVLKHTAEDNPDKYRLRQVVEIIRGFLTRVNEESGKAENRFNLLQLDQQLVFRNVEPVDLRLRDESRELLYKGPLKRRGGNQSENGDLQVFLFDHALLMVKAKTKHEQFRVYKRPIPLELLVVSAHEELPSGRPSISRPRQTIMKRNSFSKEKDTGNPLRSASTSILPLPSKQDNRNGFPITFMHLGRKGYVITLWAATVVGRKKWLEAIAKQQEVLREKSMVFDTLTLSDSFFLGANKVNCAAPFSQGMQIAYGTDTGVYFSNLRDPSKEPVQVLALLDVMQVDVLEEYELLVVLSERSVMTFPLDALDPSDPTAGLKRAKKVSSHTSFFKAGTCLGRTLVCVVKASALSSTIKTLEPIDQNVRGKNKPTFRKLLQGGNDTLRVFKEFYIPTESSSIHFLKTKLCVGCTKGFEIVDLETLDTQGLLDPADGSLDFVQKKENCRPVAIYRIENEFLLCYDEFAFYVNKNGLRARPNWIIHWEGEPTSFALHYPYVLAVEPTFIEVRHVDNGQLVQVIPGNNLRCLFADTPPSLTNSAANYTYGQNSYVRGNPYAHAQYNGRAWSAPPVASWQYPGYASQAAGPGYPYVVPQAAYPPMHRSQTYARDEIIIVSGDKVMAVRLAPPPNVRQQQQQQQQLQQQQAMSSDEHGSDAGTSMTGSTTLPFTMKLALSLVTLSAASVATADHFANRNARHNAYVHRRDQILGRQAASSSHPPSSLPVSTPAAASTPVATGASSVAVTAAPAVTTPTVAGTVIPPLDQITSGAPIETPLSMFTTFTAGASAPYSGAPALPTLAAIVPGNYPALDTVPPVDSPQVKQWLSQIDLSKVPNLGQTKDGSCASDPTFATDTTRCWWTCGGCTRPTDVVTCPDKLSWGVSYDDGPSPYTPKLVNYLHEKNLTATFFVVGSRVISRPDMLQTEYMLGHEISIHTWSHTPLTTLTNEQIVAELGWTRQAIKDVIGVTPTSMRPPYGDIDDRVRAVCQAMGLTPIIWTGSGANEFDTDDWKIPGGTATGPSSYAAWQKIVGLVSTMDTGFIVLEHDLYQQSVDMAVGYIVPDALAHQPALKLESIIECLHQPASNAYAELFVNGTGTGNGAGTGTGTGTGAGAGTTKGPSGSGNGAASLGVSAIAGFLEAIRSVSPPGKWKTLVVDDHSQRLLAAVLKTYDVLEENVTLIESISSYRQPGQTIEAMYLLMPTTQNVDRIIADYSGAQTTYAGAHLFFLDALPEPLFTRLCSSPAEPYLKRLSDLYINFRALEAQVFSLHMPHHFFSFFCPPASMSTVAAARARIDEDLHFTAKGLLNVLISLGENPLIRYWLPDHPPLGALTSQAAPERSSPAEGSGRWRGALSSNAQSRLDQGDQGDHLTKKLALMLQKELDDYIKANPDYVRTAAPNRQKTVLLITERTMDMSAPLVHEFTYQAMCNDLLPIEEGMRYRYKFQSSVGTYEDQTVTLSDADQIWTKIRHLHMQESIQTLMQDFNKFLEENAGFTGNSGASSVNDMKDMLASLPQFKEQREKFSVHLNMAQESMDIYAKKNLEAVAKVEQCCATGTTAEGKTPKTLVEDM
ncbi:RHO1 GDP-GTP exchange protein 2, partial [Tulasnella sp. 403]